MKQPKLPDISSNIVHYESVISYDTAYNDLLEYIEKEKEAIHTFDFTTVNVLMSQKQEKLESFRFSLIPLIEKSLSETFSSDLKKFIKSSNNYVKKVMEENIQLLQIESSILKNLFIDMAIQYKKPVVTYGIYKKKNNVSHTSVTPREI